MVAALLSTRSIYEFYAKGFSYEEMHQRNRDVCARWTEYVPDTSFKYVVSGYNRSISQSRQREIIESFSYMGLLGKIDMKNPQITFGCFEECAFHLRFGIIERTILVIIIDEDMRRTLKEPCLLHVYFGKLVGFFLPMGA
jgi:tRNA (guanine10-N2)-methyltransferase